MFAMQPEQCNTPLVSKYTAGFFGSGGKNRHVPSKGLWPNAAGEKSNRTISLFIRWLSILSPLTGISALAAVQVVGFFRFSHRASNSRDPRWYRTWHRTELIPPRRPSDAAEAAAQIARQSLILNF